MTIIAMHYMSLHMTLEHFKERGKRRIPHINHSCRVYSTHKLALQLLRQHIALYCVSHQCTEYSGLSLALADSVQGTVMYLAVAITLLIAIIVNSVECIETPVSILRRVRDIVHYQDVHSETCNEDNKTTFDIALRSCRSNEDFFNGNLLQLISFYA